MNVEQTIRNYLPQVIHLSLATASGKQPWVCEVHYCYDDKLNLYFRSLPSTRHSQELTANPYVAGNIVMQHQPGEKPQGVYFEGQAQQLGKVDQHHPAYLTYAKRFEKGSEILEMAVKPDGIQFYQITVSSFYVFDARDSVPSQKYHLDWSHQA